MLNASELTNYKVAQGQKGQRTLVRVGNAIIGGTKLTVIAGPCAVESEENLLDVARALKLAGADILRGGAYKPRTSPYSFQGLGEEGLKMLATARNEVGLPVVTEVTDTRTVELVSRYADMLQIGSRNMQNFELLKEAGRSGKPVLLKRGFACTVEEWLLAAEYILNEGNDQVVLCERGIRTFETATRNTLDIAAIPLARRLSHLPVLVDPSHASGQAWLVNPIAMAGVACGSDGVMVEVHSQPESALSDGKQSLTPAQFEQLMRELAPLAAVMGRTLSVQG